MKSKSRLLGTVIDLTPTSQHEFICLQDGEMLLLNCHSRRSVDTVEPTNKVFQCAHPRVRQTWPHDQIKLVFMDTSQNADFTEQVRDWISRCDYADVRHFKATVADPGLADRDRRDGQVQDEVRTAVARIYTRMAREVTTDYVWVLEDDILPPDDVCERLLRGFDPQTASVSAAYDSRFDGQPCVWDRNIRHYPVRGTGLQSVGGNGFGCVVLRGGLLRETVFTAMQNPADYDRAFYHRLHGIEMTAKVDWSCHCRHGQFETVDSQIDQLEDRNSIQAPSLSGLSR